MIEFGAKHRPVGRYVPRAILDRFDRVADWLDVPMFTVRGFKVERWFIPIAIATIASCAAWGYWTGAWWMAFTVGPLMTVMMLIWLW
jgi:hypothetical protein